MTVYDISLICINGINFYELYNEKTILRNILQRQEIIIVTFCNSNKEHNKNRNRLF